MFFINKHKAKDDTVNRSEACVYCYLWEKAFQDRTGVVSYDMARISGHQIYLDSDQKFTLKGIFRHDQLSHQLVQSCQKKSS